jgi:SAM-dependent methyltransferase
LSSLVDDGAEIVELGVGTGRIAVPLATASGTRRCRVTGVDASGAMLARLGDRDHDGLVDTVLGDMSRDLPDGPFQLAYVAYNTLFNLTGEGEQAACFSAVATRLATGGRFVVEAFVPDPHHGRHDDVSVRTLAADRVVLSVSIQHPDRQMAEGQFIEITERDGVRLRPWSVRYASVEQLDEIAAASGFFVEHRWSGFDRAPFDHLSDRHVTVYRRR